MERYRLIKELITLAEKFEQEQDSDRMEDFIYWLNQERFPSLSSSSDHGESPEMMLTFWVLQSGKRFKNLSRDLFRETPFASFEDYSFLLHIEQAESIRKMELVHLHALEAPTGIEIIKRLLGHGLIMDFKDPEDKRAKRVKITSDGKAALAAVTDEIGKVYGQFSEGLSPKEKLTLVGLLMKMNRNGEVTTD